MSPANQWEIMRRRRRKAPVPVQAVALDLGIKVYVGGWEDPISGLIQRDPKLGGRSGYAIIVNNSHSDVRQRFTIAHEIGHYVYHRESIGDGITDDALYRSHLGGAMETHANRFAAWLLMPWNLIVREVERGADSVERLAEIFRVSKSAMSIRLQVPFETE